MGTADKHWVNQPTGTVTATLPMSILLRTFFGVVGTHSRRSRRRLSDNDVRCHASDRRWFRARPAQHVHRRRNNGKGQIQSALASAHGRNGERRGETRNATQRRTPERIDPRRRCTRLDHRTCCRGSRGSASLCPRCENASKRATPDAPETIDDRGRSTGCCYRTIQGGSRASLPTLSAEIRLLNCSSKTLRLL